MEFLVSNYLCFKEEIHSFAVFVYNLLTSQNTKWVYFITTLLLFGKSIFGISGLKVVNTWYLRCFGANSADW